MDLNSASGYILHRLKKELKPTLYYHCLAHTLDVLDAARRLSDMEKVDPESRILIETAALYHDSGMMLRYKDHEEASAELAGQVLPGFGYTQKEISTITGLIMVTKLPQRPGNHHEQIICDADLDYLGRDDFYAQSFNLQLEWKLNGIRNTNLSEWLDIQIKFLTQHQYFTQSAILLRTEGKLKHLEEILGIVSRES